MPRTGSRRWRVRRPQRGSVSRGRRLPRGRAGGAVQHTSTIWNLGAGSKATTAGYARSRSFRRAGLAHAHCPPIRDRLEAASRNVQK